MGMIGFLIALLIWGAPSPAGAGPRLQGPLAAFEGLVGCWHGAFARTASIHDDRCFTPMFDGAYLRDVHAVMGGPDIYRGEAIYRYDARRRRIEAIYFASDGGVSQGAVVVRPDGFKFPPSRFVGADGESLTIRARWRRVGPDQFVATSEIKEGARWRPHLNITYVRAPEQSH